MYVCVWRGGKTLFPDLGWQLDLWIQIFSYLEVIPTLVKEGLRKWALRTNLELDFLRQSIGDFNLFPKTLVMTLVPSHINPCPILWTKVVIWRSEWDLMHGSLSSVKMFLGQLLWRGSKTFQVQIQCHESLTDKHTEICWLDDWCCETQISYLYHFWYHYIYLSLLYTMFYF